MFSNLLKNNEEMFVLKPCKTGAAFQGTPKKNVKLDLSKYETILKQHGYEIILHTNDVLIVKSKYDISIFPSGRVLIKDVKSEKDARAELDKIFMLLCLK